MKPTSAPALEQRVKQLRADIDALIDARARVVARENPGVPIGVVRNMLMARAPSCPCSQYLDLFAGPNRES